MSSALSKVAFATDFKRSRNNHLNKTSSNQCPPSICDNVDLHSHGTQ
jgi:hypothetical protein